jgi:hypothetical protein
MPDENIAAGARSNDDVNDLVDEHVAARVNTEPESGEHAAPDGAPLHPLIDLSRDPTPGKPDHARPDGQ